MQGGASVGGSIYPHPQNDVEFEQGVLAYIYPQHNKNDVKIKQGLVTRFTPAFTLAEGATHVAMPPTIKRFFPSAQNDVEFVHGLVTKFTPAFTLAEVLITLGIIGVVAAMTIPGLMTANKAQRMRTQYLKSYSVIQQAFRTMEADDVSVDPSTYDRLQNPFYDTFKNYFKVAVDCGSIVGGTAKAKPCYKPSTSTMKYKTLDGHSNINSAYFDDYQFVLMDGTFINVDSPSGNSWVWVMADINGADTPPNRMGYDLFVFEFKDGELRVMGDPKTRYNDLDKYCSITATDTFNGFACSYRAKNESDYFKWVVKNVK